jgi:hypothetical protein
VLVQPDMVDCSKLQIVLVRQVESGERELKI